MRNGVKVVVELEVKEGSVLDEGWWTRRQVQIAGRGCVP